MSINIFNLFGGEPEGNYLFPTRDPGAVSGSDFVQDNMNVGGLARESNVLDEIIHGNLPNFLRDLTPVVVTKGADTITYLVTTDFLCIGHDDNYVRVPMSPLTAQKIADKFDCSLPTRKMVNDIHKNAINKLDPLPWGPPYDADMEKTHRIGTHNQRIQKQLQGKNPFELTSGHKKDIVLTQKLAPKNPNKVVAIYGWIQDNGQPIQGLNTHSHGVNYADYSHGARLIANDVVVNGNPMRIQDVFKDSKLCGLLSDEGPLTFTRY